MFGFKKAKPCSVTTVIGQDTLVSGGMCYHQGMHIDGKVNGNVFPNEMSKSSLSIGENGVVDGNVYAETLMTNGTITGDLYASHTVQLGSSAKIIGNVYYHKLEMAMGAEVIGNLVKVTKAAWDAMSVKNSAELDKAPAIEDLNNE